MVITFNFKDGTETITFADLEKSALGSDFKVSGAPNKNLHFCVGSLFLCKKTESNLNPSKKARNAMR